tara:strand:+ start:1294 stop:1710 length:417 start_codon:yes stop_codon:yes gene_type:complete
MVKLIRKPARKVYTANKLLPKANYKKWQNHEKKEKELESKFQEVKKAESLISQIQKEIAEQTLRLSKKETELTNTANVLSKFNNLKLSSLSEEDIKQITEKQQGFLKDLLEHYTLSKEKLRKASTRKIPTKNLLKKYR